MPGFPIGSAGAAGRSLQRPAHASVPSRSVPPSPQSQSFSRSYGSILPTSLIYIVLSTRGCTPWRPDAVVSTPGGGDNLGPCVWIFKGRRQRSGHARGARALPVMYPYLQAICFQGNKLLTRKENSSRGCLRRLHSTAALPLAHFPAREY